MNNKLPYCFKFYYTDGTSEYVGGKGKSPTTLYNDFDGLMEWTEFYKLQEKDMTTTKILEMAMELYKDYLKKEYYRIDIVNHETEEIIDSLEKNRYYKSLSTKNSLISISKTLLIRYKTAILKDCWTFVLSILLIRL